MPYHFPENKNNCHVVSYRVFMSKSKYLLFVLNTNFRKDIKLGGRRHSFGDKMIKVLSFCSVNLIYNFLISHCPVFDSDFFFRRDNCIF
jgi:hypothetical protein